MNTNDLSEVDLTKRPPPPTPTRPRGKHMSHDRGCPCGKEPYEYDDCLDTDCLRRQKPDTERGLYRKFTVNRTDGKSGPGQKHYGCDYFVLDLTHDTFAISALLAYAEACVGQYPQLAIDLHRKVAELEGRA